MKSFIFLLILVIIVCNNIERQPEEELIIKDAISYFLSRMRNVVDNCGMDLYCIEGQVKGVWDRLYDSEKEEIKSKGLKAVRVACRNTFTPSSFAEGICDIICGMLKLLI